MKYLALIFLFTACSTAPQTFTECMLDCQYQDRTVCVKVSRPTDMSLRFECHSSRYDCVSRCRKEF